RPKHRLRTIALDLDDDLEGPAGRIHVRADELDGACGLGRWEAVGDDFDLVALPNLQEVLFLDVDPRQERLGPADLEDRLRPRFRDLLAHARGLLGHGAG